MLSAAIFKALQVYGIAIVVSMIVAVLIKVMVVLTKPAKRPDAKTAAPADAARKETPHPVQKPSGTATPSGTPDEVIAAISAAINIVIGPHRILDVKEKNAGGAQGSQV